MSSNKFFLVLLEGTGLVQDIPLGSSRFSDEGDPDEEECLSRMLFVAYTGPTPEAAFPAPSVLGIKDVANSYLAETHGNEVNFSFCVCVLFFICYISLVL